MSSTMIFAAAVALLAGTSLAWLASRRANTPGPGDLPGAVSEQRSPIVIHLPPDARMRLVRDQGLSYSLEVDDTVRITGIGMSQMTRVATSLVGGLRGGAIVDDRSRD